MLLNAVLGLLAATTAFASPIDSTAHHVKRVNSSSPDPTALIAQVRAADSAAQRNQILAQNGGNSSFVFDFAHPPAAAVISNSAGTLIAATGTSFPALTDIDAAMGLVTIQPCGLILPHIHPRADEFIIVTEGQILTQFIAETGAALVTNELNTLGATLFPKGSIHFEYNNECSPAAFVAAFNSNDPGVSFVAANLFSLEDQVVIASLGGDAVISGAELASIRHALPAGLATLVQQCTTKCGIKTMPKRSLKEAFGQ